MTIRGVIRPKRAQRRRGKSDPIDACPAAQQALAEPDTLPIAKTSDGPVERIRRPRFAPCSARPGHPRSQAQERRLAADTRRGAARPSLPKHHHTNFERTSRFAAGEADTFTRRARCSTKGGTARYAQVHSVADTIGDDAMGADSGAMHAHAKTTRSSEDVTPEEVLSSFFGFGASQWQEVERKLVPQPYRWIMDHPNSWYTNRTETPPPGGEKVVVYLGEAGTGKTTQLNYDVERLTQQNETNLVIRIDLSHLLLKSSQLATFVQNVWEHVDAQIVPVVERRGLRQSYLASRHRSFMGRRAREDANGLREIFGYNGPRDFSKMTDAELAKCGEIRDAIESYEQRTGDGSIGLLAVQNIADFRTILCVDNVDHLGIEKVEIVMGLLTGAIERDTEAFIAVRPEHYHLLKAFRSTRPVTVIPLAIEDDLVFKIARTRCAGAIDYARENGVNLHSVTSYAQRMLDLVAAIEEDEHSIALLNQWHNGDLRQMLFFLSLTSWSAFNKDSHASIRSLIYRNLVRSSLPKSLLALFDPARHPSSNSKHPFAFPKLRVLAYLNHHRALERPLRLERILGDFEDSFGLPRRVIEDAIFELSDSPPTSGALLRLTDEGPANHVLLLPAGAVFMSHIVFSCDFLSWLYDQSTADALPKVQADPLDYRQVKLDKASNVLSAKLLRVFAIEHPYMIGRSASPADARRLHRYESMFGYRPGGWFVDQLVDTLKEYSGKRSLDETVLRFATRAVDEASARLTAVYYHPGL